MSGAEGSSPALAPPTAAPPERPSGRLRASRLLLAAGGVVLAASLFLPWFDDVTGWEHWRWVDVVFAVLAADLVAAAFLRPLVAHRAVIAVFCALGVAVVLGHGFEMRVDVDLPFVDVQAGPYVALAALAAGFVGAVAPWRRAGALLLAVATALLVAGLFTHWGSDRSGGSLEKLGGDYFFLRTYGNAFERWHVLDLGLVALAIVLLVVAVRRVPRVVTAGVGVACVAAGACVVLAGNLTFRGFPSDAAIGLALGPLLTLIGLTAAVAGLALRVTPRGRAARAG